MVKSGSIPWSALYREPFLTKLTCLGLEIVNTAPLAVVHGRTTQEPPPFTKYSVISSSVISSSGLICIRIGNVSGTRMYLLPSSAAHPFSSETLIRNARNTYMIRFFILSPLCPLLSPRPPVITAPRLFSLQRAPFCILSEKH